MMRHDSVFNVGAELSYPLLTLGILTATLKTKLKSRGFAFVIKIV